MDNNLEFDASLCTFGTSDTKHIWNQCRAYVRPEQLRSEINLSTTIKFTTNKAIHKYCAMLATVRASKLTN